MSLRARAMDIQEATSGGEGLERSCRDAVAGSIWSSRPTAGVELFRARFSGEAYRPHRHDTYAIGVTDHGVQVFDYRGARWASRPGQVVVLYPDEAHDGRAGTGEGFGYRIVYVEPALLAEAIRVLRGRPCPLPFLPEPVSTSAELSRAVADAFRAPLEPLAVDGVIVELAEGLLTGERKGAPARRGSTAADREKMRAHVPLRIDVPAVERARQFLTAERTRVVHSSELESITGLTRYDLARQFKAIFGTSPYRYLLMRRLDLARDRIRDGHPLAVVACDAGFADQAHLTRAFRAAFGLTPSRYRALAAATSAERRRSHRLRSR